MSRHTTIDVRSVRRLCDRAVRVRTADGELVGVLVSAVAGSATLWLDCDGEDRFVPVGSVVALHAV